MSLYGVWVQPITDDTTPANVVKYGEVLDVDAMLDESTDNMSRDFCDGQTSPMAPRYADDSMGQLFFESEEAAMYVSGILRDDILARISASQLNITIPGAWGAINIIQPSAMIALLEGIREVAKVSTAVTDSQIEYRLTQYIEANGMIPSPEEFALWLKTNDPGW